MGVVESTSKIN